MFYCKSYGTNSRIQSPSRVPLQAGRLPHGAAHVPHLFLQPWKWRCWCPPSTISSATSDQAAEASTIPAHFLVNLKIKSWVGKTWQALEGKLCWEATEIRRPIDASKRPSWPSGRRRGGTAERATTNWSSLVACSVKYLFARRRDKAWSLQSLRTIWRPRSYSANIVR